MLRGIPKEVIIAVTVGFYYVCHNMFLVFSEPIIIFFRIPFRLVITKVVDQ